MVIFSTIEVAGLGLEPLDRRRAPCPAHHRLVLGEALEQRRVALDAPARRARR